MTQEQEQWRPVVDYEGTYEVSDLGNIRSVRREVLNKHGRIQVFSARKKACRPSDKGYLQVKLYKDGEKKNGAVHRIVAAAFLGPCPDGHVVDHIDRDRGNPKLTNLQHMTQEDSDAQGGRGSRGESSSCSKLTEAQALEIRKDPRPSREIAAEHGVSADHVRRIQRGLYWGWLSDAETVGE